MNDTRVLAIHINTGPVKMAQTTYYHINFNALSSVQYIYAL